ncbi:putative thioredoxin-like protein [Dioscorea sansibarensis]
MALLLSLFFFFCSCFLFNASLAQIKIPAKFDGFVYKDVDLKMEKSIMVEAFFDPLCPDSRDAWPPLKQALDHYSQVYLTVHPFPLPYHNNAFSACQLLHIANKMNTSSTYPLLDLFFKFQNNYYNGPTYNMSKSSIVNDMANLAVTTIGKDKLPEVLSAFKDDKINTATRISFKYGCSRGVTGTPFFFVNGFALQDFGTTLNYTDWRNIIDPLVEKL